MTELCLPGLPPTYCQIGLGMSGPIACHWGSILGPLSMLEHEMNWEVSRCLDELN